MAWINSPGIHLILLWIGCIEDGMAQDDYQIRTVDQCYGEPVPVVCNPGHMIRVMAAYYRQTPTCKGSFHSNFCSREEASNPACVGNQTCIFNAPWVYLTPECGYSNNFLVTYQCIPAKLRKNICLEEVMRNKTGFLISPHYPAKYPPARRCRTRIIANPGQKINIYLLDLYLAYYNYDITRQCADMLWIAEKGQRTDYLCSGQQRGLVFSSNTNRVSVIFHSEDQQYLNAKGFWLYYEIIDDQLMSSTKGLPPMVTTPIQTTIKTTIPTETTSATTTTTSTTAQSTTTTSTSTTSTTTPTTTSTPTTTTTTTPTTTTTKLTTTKKIKSQILNYRRNQSSVEPSLYHAVQARDDPSSSPKNPIQINTTKTSPKTTTMSPNVATTTPHPRYRAHTDLELQTSTSSPRQVQLTSDSVMNHEYFKRARPLPDEELVPVDTRNYEDLSELRNTPHDEQFYNSYYEDWEDNLEENEIISPTMYPTNTDWLQMVPTHLPVKAAEEDHTIGFIIGSAVGCGVVAIILCLVAALVWRSRRNRSHPKHSSSRTGHLERCKKYEDIILAYDQHHGHMARAGLPNLAFERDSPSPSLSEFPVELTAVENPTFCGGTMRSWRGDGGRVSMPDLTHSCGRLHKKGSKSTSLFFRQPTSLYGKKKSKSMDDMCLHLRLGKNKKRKMHPPEMGTITMSLSLESLEDTDTDNSSRGGSMDMSRILYETIEDLYSESVYPQRTIFHSTPDLYTGLNDDCRLQLEAHTDHNTMLIEPTYETVLTDEDIVAL